MSTNDHTVPQHYLRRFSQTGHGKHPRLVAAPVENLDGAFTTTPRNVAAVRDFYWGTDTEGVPHHTMETVMTSIERAATPAFSEVLDTRWALPERWPPTLDVRVRLAWWVAAQLLRTTRQRYRLDHLAEEAGDTGDQEVLNPTAGPLHRFNQNNRHLRFVTQHIAPLAAILSSKPWGIGFSDACLPTSDVPVLLLSDQDAEDQLLSAAYWDIVVPLDPHRFLFMTRPRAQPDPATWGDHRLKLPGGLGLFVGSLLWSAAERHMFWHPEHEPHAIRREGERGARLPRPWAGEAGTPDQGSMLRYRALPSDANVDRRWLTDHPPRRPLDDDL